jgi:hypothetical protein
MRGSLLAAGALLAAAGCSGASDQVPAQDATERPAQVVAVRVVVSGGITGGREVFDVRRDEVPRGMTPAGRDRVLDLAGRLAAGPGGVAGGGAGAGAGCCDVRTVQLRIRYDDGTRDRLAVPETDLPAPATRLVAMVTRDR